MRAVFIGAWRYSALLCLGLLTAPLIWAQSPPNQEERPRAYIAGRMRFSDPSGGWTRGYCAGFSMNDRVEDANDNPENSLPHEVVGHAVMIGAQSDWNDPWSSGVPKVHSNVNYLNDDLGHGTGFQYEYGDYVFDQNTWYQVELRYLDDQKKAQFLVDDQVVYEVPAILEGRIYFGVLICGADNGDTVNADFENVTVGGYIPDPAGNGFANEVKLSGPWNTTDYNFWGLRIQQTNTSIDDVRHWIYGANFHAEGVMTGMPPGLDWDTVEAATGMGPQATAMNAEYWFGR